MAWGNNIEIEKGQTGEVNFNLPPKIDNITIDYTSPLNIGRIAQYKDGVLCNMDNTASPIIAGAVIRNVNNAIENGDTYISTGDGAVFQVDVLSQGLVYLALKDGDTPEIRGDVYVIIDGDDAGKVTTDTTALKIKGYFNRPIGTGIWEVFIQL